MLVLRALHEIFRQRAGIEVFEPAAGDRKSHSDQTSGRRVSQRTAEPERYARTEGESRESLGLTGEEVLEICGVPAAISGSGTVKVIAVTPQGKRTEFEAKARIDTPQEAEYYRNGGILPFVLRQLVASATSAA